MQDQRDLIEQDRFEKKSQIKALQYEQSKIENVKQVRFEQVSAVCFSIYLTLVLVLILAVKEIKQRCLLGRFMASRK